MTASVPILKTALRNPKHRSWLVATALAVFLFAIPLVTSTWQLRRASQLIVLVLAVLGANLLTGYTGVISLGHGVFVGFGAFATANLLDTGMSLPFAIICATVMTGVIGIILGLPAVRLRGLSLALLTFGYAVAFQPVSRRFGSWTGGSAGRNVDTDFMPPTWLGIDRHAATWRYVVCLLVVCFWFALTRNLVRSRLGRAARAIRDDELAASQFGVDVVAVKAGMLGIASAMAGTAGGLQAALFPWVNADQFELLLSLRLYAAAVLGGLGTLLGAVLGVVALIAFPILNDLTGVLENDAVVLGIGLIIMTLMAPGGLAGLLGRWTNPADVAEPGPSWWDDPDDVVLSDAERADTHQGVYWIELD